MMRGIVAFVVIGAGILALLAIARFNQSSSKAAAQDRTMASAFLPNPANDTSVSVRGWSQSDLLQILCDFRGLYDLSKHSDWTITETSHGDLTVAFPSDIQPKLLLFLVNYIQYPKNFDLTHRSIGVVGRVTLTAAFGVPELSLIGKRAIVYVPADDAEYDLVYARVDSRKVYQIPFATLIWVPVNNARIPISVSGLLGSTKNGL